jgi:hypothetical protein
VPEFEINSVTDRPIVSPETPYRDPDDFADVLRTRAREGLPAKFRMRHAAHYVEQLMGDAPLQTVRQIPLDQLEAPEVTADLSQLVASIREVGVLQPLLVAAREGSRFELVAGHSRIAAARQAGLTAVPCLVVNADEEAAARLRAHADLRSIAERSPQGQTIPDDAAPMADVLRAAFSEISKSMRFIDALTPIACATGSSARASMIVDAISVEVHRATTLGAAAALLMRKEPPKLEPVDAAAIFEAIRSEVRIEARLRGVDVQWTDSVGLARTVGDTEALTTGWSALVHAMLGVAGEGDRLEISLTAPRVRPALILQATVRGEAGAIRVDRFLDTHWPEHPAGPAGAMMLSGALHSARLHAGRLTVRATGDGLALTFVVPQPLELF